MERTPSFDEILRRAQIGEKLAMQQLIDMYDPVIKKHSIFNSTFDEDCYQYLVIRFIKEVRKFRL